ncbi:DUF2786 domain-containing protein [Desulfocurvus vexinensis]|uniref:DUF2786 domain-containing protein n=1 Tax=Desulfocurvus vexinensis TaxID=399548 RepID=UPI000686739C|nr:DUF2786 domain-containing protein [Desulfocurvus vexinensis]
MDSQARLLDKVRKLLALAGSDNEHEAAAAAAKAQALLAEHNLSLADVPADETGTSAWTAEHRTRKCLEKWAHRLAFHTAEAFGCQYFHDCNGRTSFVGCGADPEVCAWTFGYLYRTLLRLGSRYMGRPDSRRRFRGSRSKNRARAAYLYGLAQTVGQRLQAQSLITPATEAALVPLKDTAIQEAMPPGLRIRQISAPQSPARWDGVRDGATVPLSTPVTGPAPSRAIQ